MLYVCVCVCLVTQSCPTLCNCMDYSPPSSSFHGDSPGKNTGVGCHSLLQGSSQPRDWTCISCIDRQILYHWATWAVSRCCWCSGTKLCPTLCDPKDCSTPGFPVLHHLPELVQTHILPVGDAIQPSCPLLSPSPPAFNISLHQCLFQWASPLHQVTKVLELQLQHQSFQ